MNKKYIIKWFKNQYFPLIPLLKAKKVDEGICGFWFKWLFFTIQDVEDFDLRIWLNFGYYWGCCIELQLFYIEINIGIHFSENFADYLDDILYRKSVFGKIKKIIGKLKK
jgi:hypothetical protein